MMTEGRKIECRVVRHGKWIFDEENDYGDGRAWMCSECGESLWMKPEWGWKYCPMCGAYLDDGE